MESNRSFQEIEPFCKWKKEEYRDILEVHLQGFKKQHLKVEVKSLSVLSISGERPVGKHKGIRFRKQINMRTDCIRSEIRPNLTGGILYIMMPRRMRKEKVGKDELPAAGWSTLINSKPTKWGVLPRLQMGGNNALKLGALAAGVVAAYICCRQISTGPFMLT